MDYQITMNNLRLVASNTKIADSSIINKARYIKATSSGSNSGPKIEGEEAKISCKLNLNVQSIEDLDKKEDTPIFEIDVSFVGDFTFPAEQAEKVIADKEAEYDVSQRMANRMFPVMKSHAEDLMQLMGAGYISLPWHLDVESMEAGPT